MFFFKKIIYLVKDFCMKVPFPAFRANLRLHIFNYIQLAMKPVMLAHFLFYRLTTTEFTDHISSS